MNARCKVCANLDHCGVYNRPKEKYLSINKV